MSYKKNHILSSSSSQRKPYIEPSVKIQALIEEVQLLAGSGPEANVQDFNNSGKDLSSPIDDE
ncbi:hypothetical protein [Prevotella sp.]